jgi:hypothetical protein
MLAVLQARRPGVGVVGTDPSANKALFDVDEELAGADRVEWPIRDVWIGAKGVEHDVEALQLAIGDSAACVGVVVGYLSADLLRRPLKTRYSTISFISCCSVDSPNAKRAPRPNLGTLIGNAGRPYLLLNSPASSSSTILWSGAMLTNRDSAAITVAAPRRWASRGFSVNSM